MGKHMNKLIDAQKAITSGHKKTLVKNPNQLTETFVKKAHSGSWYSSQSTENAHNKPTPK